jgi:hypothetical protein
VPAFAQGDLCAREKQLRQAAFQEFFTLREKEIVIDSKLKFDLKTFQTSFRLPGSKLCEITVYDSGTRQMKCDWELIRGLSSREAALQAYVNTVRGFLACVPANSEIDEDESKDKKMVSTSIVFSPQEWPKRFSASIEIELHFFAPWWYMHVTYSRHQSN